jgi:hypothetical protein
MPTKIQYKEEKKIIRIRSETSKIANGKSVQKNQ